MPRLRALPWSPLLVALAACEEPLPPPGVTIEPAAPTTLDDLVATADVAATQPLAYTWKRDGAIVPGLTGVRVPADQTQRGEQWTVEAEIDLGEEPGPVGTASVTIGNAAPSAIVALTPEAPAGGTELFATATGADPDADPVTFRYRWLANGAEIAGASGASLVPSGLGRGTVVGVAVTPTDGELEGPEVTAEVTLGNTAPQLVSVAIGPTPLSAAVDAVALVEALDPEGDPLTFTYAWSINGTPTGISALVPKERLYRGALVDLTVTVSDGEDESAPASATQVLVGNAAPTVGRVRLQPATLTEATVVTCAAEQVDDADNDTFTLAYAWLVDGQPVSGVTTSTLTGEHFSRGSTVSCTATASDAEGPGAATASPAITVGNSAPVIRSGAITSASPRPGDPLTLTLDVVDLDGDTVTLDYQWFVEGAPSGSASELPAVAFTRDQDVFCRINATDGTNASPAYDTPTVRIRNGAPVVSAVTFEPEAPNVTTDIVAVPVGEDPEGDTISYTYAWRINGAPVSGVSGNRLAGNRYRRGQSVTVTVTPADPTTEGDPFVSPPVIVANAAPAVASTRVSPVPPDRGTGATCIPSGWSDPDGDAPGYQFTWYQDGAVTGATASLAGNSLAKGQLLRCTVIPDDGFDLGPMVGSSSVRVGNATPSLASVTISPATPREIDTLNAVVTGLSDPDPEDAGNLTPLFVWWVNDSTVEGVDGPSLTGEHFDRGDVVYVLATAFDGAASGELVSSNLVSVRNMPPSITSVQISPASPQTDSTLTAVVVASDPDPADATRLTYTYDWAIDGFTTQTGTSPTLPGSAFSKGQRVRVGVVASDGTASSTRITSSEVTIRNALPTQPGIQLTPRWTRPGSSPLRCDVIVPSTDADNETVTYTITWLRNGVVHTAGNGYLGPTRTTLANDTIPAADLGPDEVWTCTVTPSDGGSTGTSSQAVAYTLNLDLASLTQGTEFGCGLDADNVVRCWGHNNVGQALPPDALVATLVDAGGGAACALTPAGQARCWGAVASPSGGTYRDVGVGALHACGLTSVGNVVCWGTNTNGSTSAPTGTYRALSVGSVHACALDTSGSPRCWGDSSSGQATPPVDRFVKLAAGAEFTCGLKLDGTLRCWGSNKLTPVPAGNTFTDVSAGAFHACAVSQGDTVTCWGDGAQVALAVPTGNYAVVAPGTTHTCATTTEGVTTCWGTSLRGQLNPPTVDYSLVEAGYDFTCGIRTDETVTCWGANGFAQATPPEDLEEVVDLALGENHACALTRAGAIFCWGDDGEDQLGAPISAGWVQLDAGADHACAVDDLGAITCWGSTLRGQTTVPLTGGPWQKVATGASHTCALADAGTVTCWGNNDLFQSIAPGGTFTDLSAGGFNTCAVRTDTQLQCWGDNQAGQSSPTVLPGWSEVTLGFVHGCARKDTGAIDCWGSSAYGLRNEPTTAGFDSVRAGRNHTCGVRSDGRPQCWGLLAY